MITAEDAEAPKTAWVTVSNPMPGGKSNLAYFDRKLDFAAANYGGGNYVSVFVPRGAVSVSTLEIPEAAREEMQKFAKNFDAGKLEAAVKHAEKALRISPQWAAAHMDLGQCYARMRQYQKAIEEFHNAAAFDTRMVQPWVSLAGAYLLEAQYAEGENAARRALEIEPTNSNARYFLGRILAMEGHDLADAIEVLRKSEEQYPAARLKLAIIYLRQKQTEEAIGELRRYIADPNAPQKDKVSCMVEKLSKPEETVNCVMQ